MSKPTPWNNAEHKAITALYFRMLACATTGKPYNKAAMVREAREGKLKDRSKGSIEAKLMNCSAAHAAIAPSAVTMDGYGYRALSNYSSDLLDAMRKKLSL